MSTNYINRQRIVSVGIQLLKYMCGTNQITKKYCIILYSIKEKDFQRHNITNEKKPSTINDYSIEPKIKKK